MRRQCPGSSRDRVSSHEEPGGLSQTIHKVIPCPVAPAQRTAGAAGRGRGAGVATPERAELSGFWSMSSGTLIVFCIFLYRYYCCFTLSFAVLLNCLYLNSCVLPFSPDSAPNPPLGGGGGSERPRGSALSALGLNHHGQFSALSSVQHDIIYAWSIQP